MIAITVGAVARGLLKAGEVAVPMGLTSRGLFLRLAGGWVIFLSTEPYPGPLTINVAAEPEALKRLENLAAGVVEPQGICFHAADLTVRTHSARLWLPPPRTHNNLPCHQITANLIQTARVLHSQKPAEGFSALLPTLWGEQVELEGMHLSTLALIRNLQSALQAGKIDSILTALEPLLGFGSGLTPSGDDLVTGIILALNRWGELLARDLDLALLNRATLELVYPKTTSLSTSLIECATLGQADQRLITALDGLLTGVPGAADCATALSRWGNSSGIDALWGMAIALTCA